MSGVTPNAAPPESKPHTPAEPPPAAPLFGTEEARQRTVRGEAIIKRNTLWALGAGALIFPWVDFAAAVAVQLKMLKELSDLYGVKFTQDLARKLVLSLLMSSGGSLVGLSAASALKAIPVVGSVLGLATFPLAAAAFTNAVGRVFLLHFETGGTLLDFDPKKVQEHFIREYERARATLDRR